MATNPVDSMPDADARRGGDRGLSVRRRFRRLATTDTIRHAHVLLPAAGWGEKDGTVTNSERRISRQRAVPAAARRGAAGLVDHLRSRQPDGFRRRFRLRSPAESSPSMPRCRASRMTARATSTSAPMRAIDATAYDDLTPFQWPARLGGGRQRTRAARSLLRRRQLLYGGPQGALHRRPPDVRARVSAELSRWCSTPAACATIGTP